MAVYALRITNALLSCCQELYGYSGGSWGTAFFGFIRDYNDFPKYRVNAKAFGTHIAWLDPSDFGDSDVTITVDYSGSAPWHWTAEADNGAFGLTYDYAGFTEAGWYNSRGWACNAVSPAPLGIPHTFITTVAANKDGQPFELNNVSWDPVYGSTAYGGPFFLNWDMLDLLSAQVGPNLVREPTGHEFLCRNVEGDRAAFHRLSPAADFSDGVVLGSSGIMVPLVAGARHVVHGVGKVSQDGGQTYGSTSGDDDPLVSGFSGLENANQIEVGSERLALAALYDGATLSVVDQDGNGCAVASVAGHSESAWIHRHGDGTWEVGLLLDGRMRTWRSTRSDGMAWSAADNQDLGAIADLGQTVAWQGEAGIVAVAGWHRETGEMRVVWRDGPSLAWSGPRTIAAAASATPYLCETVLGGWQLGWLDAGVWHRWEADHPGAAWTED